MTAILQLNPVLPVYTKLGKGRALFILDYGADINTCWIVVLNKTSEIKHFDSNDIRLEENYTYGTGKPELPEDWKL